MSTEEPTRRPRGTAASEGVRKRHARSCTSAAAACNCSPSWEASAWSPRDGKRVYRSFPTKAAAKAWRADATVAIKQGRMKAASKLTLRAAWDAWSTGAEEGTIRTRSGDVFKPSTLRGYRAAMRGGGPIMLALGARKLSSITRQDVAALVARHLADGADPSTVRNAIMPLRVLFRRAISDGEITVNPVTGIELPAVRGRRDRIASPEEAVRLIAALPLEDRAVWSTAMYGGLRAGELMALRWSDIDLAAGVIRVERAYDPKGGGQFVEVKSRAGQRKVPITAVLREALLDHKLRPGLIRPAIPDGDGHWLICEPDSDVLAFARRDGRPFSGTALRDRARRAWKAAGLDPIGLHECRHTFASVWIAAGVGAKALSTFMGHANVAITLDRYGHLLPGSEVEAAGLVDAFLARADTASRLSALDG
jgi:integrase